MSFIPDYCYYYIIIISLKPIVLLIFFMYVNYDTFLMSTKFKRTAFVSILSLNCHFWSV